MKKKRKWPKRFGVGILMVMGLLLILYFFAIRGSVTKTFSQSEERSNIAYSSTPTLLFPGWGGYTYSYNSFIKYAQAHHYGEHTMTVYVTPHNHISTRGSLKSGHNPIVQVIYTWNYSASYSPHIKQVAAVINYLHQHYNMNSYNVVGHSYGGSAWVNAYFRYPSICQAARVKRVMLLATPVEETLNPKEVFKRSLIHKSTDEHFREMMKEKPQVKNSQWPEQVYNVMGVAKDKKRTDGAVPAIQAEMIRPLFKHKPIQYHEHTFYHITHTGLHQQSRVLKYAMNRLWAK